MDKKVDTSAMMGGQRNSMTERAPLVGGSDEVAGPAPSSLLPSAADALSKAVTQATSYEELNTDENKDFHGLDTMEPEVPFAVRFAADRNDALVSVDEDSKPSGVLVGTIGQELVKAPVDPSTEVAPPSPVTALEKLAKQVEDLTKRLEDFGAIPREADTKPYVPVVTMTKAGNTRTDN